jgi:hypothetical protein
MLPSSGETYEIKLMDMAGKVVLERSNASGSLNIDISNISKGMYILNGNSKQQNFYHKLIIR